MLSPLTLLVLGAPLSVAVSVFDRSTTAQIPWKKPHHPSSPPHHPHAPPRDHADPYKTFVDHFDSHRAGTDTYLQSHFIEAYPNNTVIVTQDPRFQLLSFAQASSSQIVVREDESIAQLNRIFYVPQLRRRDGAGHLIKATVLAGYKIAWGDEELSAIVASYPEGYSTVTQWHLIVDHGKDRAAYSLIQACTTWATTIRDAVLVFDQGYWRPDYQLFQAVQKASWDDVVLDDKFKRSIQNDYRSFFKSEETYKRLEVPWKRGLIFMGPPGNGKTISLKAIMKEVKVPLLYVKSLHKIAYMGDEFGIRSIFEKARTEAPCVLIMEDLDSLINDQNRAFFLNEVDGLEDNDGLLLIGSTNHFDRLDPALSSRPSRFDRKYNFPNPNHNERRDYAVYWQHKLADKEEIEFPDSLVDEFADKTDKFSFAYMKEAFIASLLLIAGQETPEKVDFAALLMDQVAKLRDQLDDEESARSESDFVSSSGAVGGGDTTYGEWQEPQTWQMGVHVEMEY